MTPTDRFIWGFCGSVAVEIVTLYNVYHKSRIAFPARYKRKGFWVVRLFLSAIAGGLAIAYEIDKPILALNIGAATPLIVQALAQGFEASPSASKENGLSTSSSTKVISQNPNQDQ
jgi:hypothetical protein